LDIFKYSIWKYKSKNGLNTRN